MLHLSGCLPCGHDICCLMGKGSNDVTRRRSPFVVSTNEGVAGEKEATVRRAAVRQKRAFWQEQGFPKRQRWH